MLRVCTLVPFITIVSTVALKEESYHADEVVFLLSTEIFHALILKPFLEVSNLALLNLSHINNYITRQSYVPLLGNIASLKPRCV